jgi:hypothetical protein
VVLSRALLALALVAGCGQSLFDAHGGGRDGGGDGGGGGDGDVPDTCAAPCIADAAADFDGSPGGTGNRWRYLDDKRDHSWVPMTGTGGVLVGTSGSIKKCAADLSAACKALPGALLVSTAGSTSPADPAVEYRSPDARVIQLAFRAQVAAGGPNHSIRLYRNSREDVLFTAPAAPGITVEHLVTVDAVAGDRFLVAVAPDGPTGGDVALHVFVSGTSKSFPSTCQLAVPFTVAGAATGHVEDLCRGEILAMNNTAPDAPLLAMGPYAEEGMGGYVESSYYYEGTETLTPVDATTLQFWLKVESSSIPDSWVFSNIDVDIGNGLGLFFRNAGGPKLEASVVTNKSPLMYAIQSASYATFQSWHFVRVVQASNTGSICIDGIKAASGPLAGPSVSLRVPRLGRSASDTTTSFIGIFDDVRVFNEALPCN